jgi:hypothetical protein
LSLGRHELINMHSARYLAMDALDYVDFLSEVEVKGVPIVTQYEEHITDKIQAASIECIRIFSNPVLSANIEPLLLDVRHNLQEGIGLIVKSRKDWNEFGVRPPGVPSIPPRPPRRFE